MYTHVHGRQLSHKQAMSIVHVGKQVIKARSATCVYFSFALAYASYAGSWVQQPGHIVVFCNIPAMAALVAVHKADSACSVSLRALQLCVTRLARLACTQQVKALATLWCMHQPSLLAFGLADGTCEGSVPSCSNSMSTLHISSVAICSCHL